MDDFREGEQARVGVPHSRLQHAGRVGNCESALVVAVASVYSCRQHRFRRDPLHRPSQGVRTAHCLWIRPIARGLRLLPDPGFRGRTLSGRTRTLTNSRILAGCQASVDGDKL